MSMFDDPYATERAARVKILAAAAIAAIATYILMNVYFDWSEPRNGLRWLYVHEAVLMGVPLFAGLLAWWRWGLGALLSVSVASSSAIGVNYVKDSYDTVRQFGEFPAEAFVALVVSGMLSTLALGLVLPLAFAVYQLWPDRFALPDEDWDEQSADEDDLPEGSDDVEDFDDNESTPQLRRKVVDSRFGP